MEKQTSLVYRNEHSYCGPISMVRRLSDGDLVVAFREAKRREVTIHADPTTRTSLIRSTDNGETWHSLVSPDPAGANGVALAEMSDGSLLVSNFRWIFVPLADGRRLRAMGGYRTVDSLGLAAACESIYVTRSTTFGFTWECPHRVDMPGLGFATTAGRIVELEDTTLIMPINGDHGTYVSASSDGGLTWTQRGMVARTGGSRGLQEMRVISTGDAGLLAMMRTPSGNFVSAFSGDGGHTWGEAKKTPIWCGGSSPGDLLLLSDRRVLCTYGHRRPPFGVRACLSSDGGVTWDTDSEIILREDGSDRDMGYPSSEQLEDGSILTVYYWHDEDQTRYLASTKWTLA